MQTYTGTYSRHSLGFVCPTGSGARQTAGQGVGCTYSVAHVNQQHAAHCVHLGRPLFAWAPTMVRGKTIYGQPMQAAADCQKHTRPAS